MTDSWIYLLGLVSTRQKNVIVGYLMKLHLVIIIIIIIIIANTQMKIIGCWRSLSKEVRHRFWNYASLWKRLFKIKFNLNSLIKCIYIYSFLLLQKQSVLHWKILNLLARLNVTSSKIVLWCTVESKL